jgi:citrate lyase subunit beta/citryl-CoA lyase
LEILGLARSALFVPGTHPERFDKAVRSGADIVVLDLEDAVSPEEKDDARRNVVRWLEESGPGAAVVRINTLGTPVGADDLEALRTVPVVGVMVPKVDSAGDLVVVAEALPDAVGVIPLIETALGLWHCGEIAAAPRATRLAFGSIDLATDLGVDDGGGDDVFGPARFQIVLASRVAGIFPPLDGVTTEIDDQGRLERDAERARRLGFGGKLCIHPRQVAGVQAVFTPTPEAVDRARRIVEAAEREGGVFQLDGRMVDKPVIDQARRTLRLSDQFH